MALLNKETSTKIVELSNTLGKVQHLSKDLFTITKDVYLSNTGKKTKEIKATLTTEVLALVSKDNKVKTHFKQIIDVASNFLSYKIELTDKQLAKLYYNRIKDITKLLIFISENEDKLESGDTFKSVRTAIQNVIDMEFLTKESLNNGIDDVITKVKADNNIKGEEDEFEFKGTEDDFIALMKVKFPDMYETYLKGKGGK